MHTSRDFREERRYPRYSMMLPLEYGRADDAYRGGLVANVSETGLLVYTIQELSVDERLSIRVFFPNEFELDGFRVLARIVWKDYHYETDWKGYKYGLAIVQISEEDRRKLFHLINSHLSSENPSLEPENPLSSAPDRRHFSSSPSSNLIEKKAHTRTCLWERFKMKVLHSR